MIQRDDFRFRSYQAAFFYASLQFRTGRVLPRLLSAVGAEFDGEPTTIPVPEGAPPEVPRIILQSADERLRMEVSSVRVDVRHRQLPVRGGETVPVEEFIALATRAIQAFNEAANAAVGRIALVVSRLQFHDRPAFALAEHFCRPELLSNDPATKGPLNRPEGFELHALKKFEMGTFLVNSWMRCKTGTLTEDEQKRPVILVEQDINTPGERLEQDEFDAGAIARFYGLAAREIETIMRLYFPV